MGAWNAFRKAFKYTQPGGKVIELRVHGSQYYARTETLEGYTVFLIRLI